MELEYLYRDTDYDPTADVPGASGATGDKWRRIVKATDRIGRITSHYALLNLRLDFPNASRYTPYVGIGVGGGRTGIEYASL